MPVITVDMWSGRSVEQKRRIVEGITRVFTEMGVPSEAITVIIRDVPKENWGHGGKLAVDE